MVSTELVLCCWTLSRSLLQTSPSFCQKETSQPEAWVLSQGPDLRPLNHRNCHDWSPRSPIRVRHFACATPQALHGGYHTMIPIISYSIPSPTGCIPLYSTALGCWFTSPLPASFWWVTSPIEYVLQPSCLSHYLLQTTNMFWIDREIDKPVYISVLTELHLLRTYLHASTFFRNMYVYRISYICRYFHSYNLYIFRFMINLLIYMRTSYRLRPSSRSGDSLMPLDENMSLAALGPAGLMEGVTIQVFWRVRIAPHGTIHITLLHTYAYYTWRIYR